jgi:hypothetical protein
MRAATKRLLGNGVLLLITGLLAFVALGDLLLGALGGGDEIGPLIGVSPRLATVGIFATVVLICAFGLLRPTRTSFSNGGDAHSVPTASRHAGRGWRRWAQVRRRGKIGQVGGAD